MFAEVIKKDYNFYKLLDHLEILLDKLISDDYNSEIVSDVDDNIISMIGLLEEIKTAKK